MKVLFLNDQNGFEYNNPLATLVEIPNGFTKESLRCIELNQRGVNRRGGRWNEIMQDGNIEHKIISKGTNKDYNEKDYDLKYNLISGNY